MTLTLKYVRLIIQSKRIGTYIKIFSRQHNSTYVLKSRMYDFVDLLPDTLFVHLNGKYRGKSLGQFFPCPLYFRQGNKFPFHSLEQFSVFLDLCHPDIFPYKCVTLVLMFRLNVNPNVLLGKVSFYHSRNRHRSKAYLSTDINKSDRYAMQKYNAACLCR